MPDQIKKFVANNRGAIITLLVGVVIGFVIGILIGRFGACPNEEKDLNQPGGTEPQMTGGVNQSEGVFLKGVPESLMRDENVTIIDDLINSIKSENIRENLKYVNHIKIK